MINKTGTNKEMVIAKAVRAILSNSRTSNAKTKKRDEVSGGGRKPWKQKGTGRARAGSNRSPIWRGGGIVFGPTGNENHLQKVNKKEKEIARSAAFEAKKDVTKNLMLAAPKKTKEAAEFLKKNEISGKVLILIIGDNKEYTEKVKKNFSNIADVKIIEEKYANTFDILRAKTIIRLTDTKKSAANEAKTQTPPGDKK